MVLHSVLIVLGFAILWLGVWVSFDIQIVAHDPTHSSASTPVLSAAAALGAALWSGNVIFAMATGRFVGASVGVGSLVLDGLVGLLAAWFALAMQRRSGFWTVIPAAFGIGAAIALRHVLPDLADIAAPGLLGRFAGQTLVATSVVFLGILSSMRIGNWQVATAEVRRILSALALGTTLAAAELTLSLGPVTRVGPPGPATVYALDERLRFVLMALVVTGVLALVDLQVRRRQRLMWQSFLTLVHDSLDLVAVLRLDGTVAYWSPSAETLLGYSGAELRGGQLARFVHQDDLAALLPGQAGDAEDKRPSRHVSVRLRRSDDAWRNFEGTATQGRQGGVTVLHLVDVTERRTAEQALLAMAVRDEQILAAVGEGILGLDGHGAVTFVNAAALAILDLAESKVVGRQIETVLREATRDGSFGLRVISAIRAALTTGMAERGRDALLVRPSGQELALDFTIAPMRQGGSGGAVALFVDVSQRRKDERQRRELAQQFLDTLDMLGDAVLVEDPSGRLIYVNRTARDLLGLRLGDKNVPGGLLDSELQFSTWQGEAIGDGEGPIKEAVRRRQPVGPIERRISTPDGQVLYCLVEAVPWQDGGGTPGVLYAIRDVTDIRQAQEEHLRVRRIESLGVFAGGIAHDFNNVLTIVLGNLALARADIAAGSESDILLQSAERTCRQAAGLTRQLLTFSRGGAPVTQSIALGPVLEESAGLKLQESRASVRVQLPADLWPVEADAGQIHEVIRNIAVNGLQAMPDGGTVQVRADNVLVEAGEVPPLLPGGYVFVTISDRGPGIASDDLERIFEPYFTTKPNGHGLGLATCWSIVRRHGGHISAQSTVGEGTVFHIYLPRAQAAEAEGETPRKEVTGARRRVLLMDDEREILAVSGEMLRRMGHSVTLARDGSEAVSACREALAAGLPIEVALLDLTVPGGMGGREAGERLLELDPDIRLVASSGYSNDAVMGDYRAFGFHAVLPKPYRREELQAVVEAAGECGQKGPVGIGPPVLAGRQIRLAD